MDKDLQSIQEVRDLLNSASKAFEEYSQFSQGQIDEIVREICEEAQKHEVELAKLANEETGFGRWEDKVLKNRLASIGVYETIKDQKTKGIICDDKEKGITEIGVPMGIIAALIPSTNPTSSTIYKIMIALKAGNAVIISPHPNAKDCIIKTAEYLIKAAERKGAPKGLIGVIKTPTLQATQELMKHKKTSLILATGGEAMVKAAYSSGTPAIGVGPGNGPAFIERSADIRKAVKRIIDSKTFDNGVICASEQSIVTEEVIKNQVVDELKRQGAYFLNKDERNKVGSILMRANNTMNPKIVGKTALYIEETWEKACEKCIEILENEGIGHTMSMHTNNENIVREFSLKKPVSRLLVNTPAALGGVGATTNLIPAFTLGCGTVGGSATSDNIGPLNLINIRRVAYGTKELEALKNEDACTCTDSCGLNNENDIESIIRQVLEGIYKK